MYMHYKAIRDQYVFNTLIQWFCGYIKESTALTGTMYTT